MKQTVILEIARQMLTHYGLDDWTVVLDRYAPRRLARTRFLCMEIGLTLGRWRRNPDTEGWRGELRATVLHEIAHVIEGIDAWHGDEWRDRYIALLDEWFDPNAVRWHVVGCSEISEDWIQEIFLPRYSEQHGIEYRGRHDNRKTGLCVAR